MSSRKFKAKPVDLNMLSQLDKAVGAGQAAFSQGTVTHDAAPQRTAGQDAAVDVGGTHASAVPPAAAGDVAPRDTVAQAAAPSVAVTHSVSSHGTAPQGTITHDAVEHHVAPQSAASPAGQGSPAPESAPRDTVTHDTTPRRAVGKGTAPKPSKVPDRLAELQAEISPTHSNRVRVTTYVSIELAAKLRLLMEREDRPESYIVQKLLNEALGAREKGQGG